MVNNSGWFRRFVMSFSFQERRTKELTKYRRRVCELENMDPDEINFEYITLKSAYEHKKSILTLLIISAALAALMNVWRYFFMFVEKALKFTSSYIASEIEIAKVSFVIALIVAASMTFLILFILIMYMKEIGRMQKELMIIETVKNRSLNNR